LGPTYQPIATTREGAHLVEFAPTDLDGNNHTFGPPDPSNRYDYILAGSNRLAAVTGYVFNSTVWAQHGLYTNASSLNMVYDTTNASDHCCAFVDYFFP